MDDLHKLAQRIADEAYEAEYKFGSAGIASAVYHYTYKAIMDNADEIAVLFCDSEWKKDVEVDPLDVITVIDTNNDLRAGLRDVLAMARRHAENPNDYEAILVDIVERAQEALNG